MSTTKKAAVAGVLSVGVVVTAAGDRSYEYDDQIQFDLYVGSDMRAGRRASR